MVWGGSGQNVVASIGFACGGGTGGPLTPLAGLNVRVMVGNAPRGRPAKKRGGRRASSPRRTTQGPSGGRAYDAALPNARRRQGGAAPPRPRLRPPPRDPRRAAP